METEIDKSKKEIIDLKEKSLYLDQGIYKHKNILLKAQETFAYKRRELDNLRICETTRETTRETR